MAHIQDCYDFIRKRVWCDVHHTCQVMPNGPLARYLKLSVAHAPRTPGTFSPPPRGSDPDMHHGTCVTHMPWCMPASLTSGFLWIRWGVKRSRHSRRMRNPQFDVSCMMPMVLILRSLRCVVLQSVLQAIARADVDLNLCRHMASLCHNVLSVPFRIQWTGHYTTEL